MHIRRICDVCENYPSFFFFIFNPFKYSSARKRLPTVREYINKISVFIWLFDRILDSFLLFIYSGCWATFTYGDMFGLFHFISLTLSHTLSFCPCRHPLSFLLYTVSHVCPNTVEHFLLRSHKRRSKCDACETNLREKNGRRRRKKCKRQQPKWNAWIA